MSMRNHPHRRTAFLLVFACFLIIVTFNRGRLESVRAVDILSIFAAGMCTGAAVASFVVAMRRT